jgi:predicted O-methyltransferase YrrM
MWEHDPLAMRNALWERMYRHPPRAHDRDLDTMPVDLPVNGTLGFEHLAGLFTSSSLDHYIISMTIRQAAYLFGLIRQVKPHKVIEVGRYRGGSTLVIAAAMNGEGEFWSIDIGEQGYNLPPSMGNQFDKRLASVCDRYGLRANLVTGDSRTIDVDTGEVDLVLIDGDHTYEGAKNDFERFGRRTRRGGSLLVDDVFDEPLFENQHLGVRRVVEEVIAQGGFKLIRAVDRLAHLERIA